MCVYTPFCYIVLLVLFVYEIRDYQVQQLPDDDGYNQNICIYI